MREEISLLPNITSPERKILRFHPFITSDLGLQNSNYPTSTKKIKPERSCELNYHDQKIRQTPVRDIRKHWTAVSTLLSLISCIYRDLLHRRSNNCWWDLIRSKQLSSVSVCRTQVFAGFSGHGNSIYNITPLLKTENIHPQGSCLKNQ